MGRVTSCFRLTSVRLNEAKEGREEQEESYGIYSIEIFILRAMWLIITI